MRVMVGGVLALGLLLIPSALPAGATQPNTVQSAAVTGFGGVSVPGQPPSQLNAPVVAVAATPDGAGYWLAASDGGVFAFGDARFYGSEAGPSEESAALPVVGMARTPDGGGYWLVQRFGAVQAFGDATSLGSLPADMALQAGIVGMAPTPDGGGYWLAAKDGGVFAFGDARFLGSEGDTHLNAPVVGIAATADGGGYWLVASDGGVFAFGDAPFSGSEGATTLDAPIVGMAATPSGAGYWLVAGDGGIFTFGSAPFEGSLGGNQLAHPVVGMAVPAHGSGYLLATSDYGPFAPSLVPSVTADCTSPSAGPAVEPSSIVLACADGNSTLENLAWSSWTAASASAAGTYVYNDCNPFCALGTFITIPGATIQLTAPVSTIDGVEFSTVTWTYPAAGAAGGRATETETLPVGVL